MSRRSAFDFARPRSVEDGAVASTASLGRADALDLITIAAGAITAPTTTELSADHTVALVHLPIRERPLIAQAA